MGPEPGQGFLGLDWFLGHGTDGVRDVDRLDWGDGEVHGVACLKIGEMERRSQEGCR